MDKAQREEVDGAEGGLRKGANDIYWDYFKVCATCGIDRLLCKKSWFLNSFRVFKKTKTSSP